MPALGETIWDQTVARRMYDQGATFVEIGACVGTDAHVVSAFAKRHWPRREARPAVPTKPRDRPTRRTACARPLRPGLAPLPPLRSLARSDE
jgi:hypothetical protein